MASEIPTPSDATREGLNFEPSIYATAALLAGLLSQGATLRGREQITAIIALWVYVDLALGVYYRGWSSPRGKGHEGRFLHRLVTIVGSAMVALGITRLFGTSIYRLALASLALGPLISVHTAYKPAEKEALPTSLQALVAWLVGVLYQGGNPNPLWAIGLLGAFGAFTRLMHLGRPTRITLTITRFCWLVAVALLILARQPLLGALVMLTALGDDLNMSQGVLQGSTKGATLGIWSWAGTWLLVAFAATYWAA